MSETAPEQWATGAPYERYVGRWSRLVATDFLDWLALSSHQVWVDVGCGTGALVGRILDQCAPRTVIGIDRSEGFLAEARRTTADRPVHFQVGDAMHLPLAAAVALPHWACYLPIAR